MLYSSPPVSKANLRPCRLLHGKVTLLTKEQVFTVALLQREQTDVAGDGERNRKREMVE